MTSGRKTKPPKPDKTPGATPTWNEWGIPDWRDPAAYGDVKRWSRARWRWEFHRRRDDLRDFFDAHVGAPSSSTAHLQPNEPGFRVVVPQESRRLFGYASLPNPRIGKQSEMTLLLSFCADEAAVQIVDGSWGQSRTLAGLLNHCCIELTSDQKARLGNAWLSAVPVQNIGTDQFAVVFNVNRPIKPQIDSARGWLKFAQQQRGLTSQRRRYPAKWRNLLRALDAREAGATWREIADLLYAQGVLSRYKSAEGGYSPPPPQAARALWLAAKGLQSNF